ncbi:glycosyl transferase family 1, partial [Thioclava sp. BHET1]
MNILFVHQNYPGQYREILRYLAKSGAHRILFMTQRQDARPIDGVTLVTYHSHHHAAADSYPLSRPFEETMGTAYGAYQAARRITAEGFRPDLILGHVGWGELTFLKEVWPDVPVLGYWEYYYSAQGGSVGFDPEFPASPDMPVLMRARNALNHLCLPEIDLGPVS